MTADIVELRATDSSSVLRPRLRGLLVSIDPWGTSLGWRLLELEARGDITTLGMTMLELENGIGPEGMPVTWEDLRRFAELVEDVTDISLVGGASARVRADSPFERLSAESSIVIELLDSTVWRVAAQDSAVLDAVRKHFL